MRDNTPERKIEEYLVARVKALGGRADKVVIVGQRGFYDRLVVLPGGVVAFVEVKKPRGSRVSRHQLKLHADYQRLGVRMAVVKTLDDVDRLLDELVG